jgi:hypothetical protein
VEKGYKESVVGVMKQVDDIKGPLVDYIEESKNANTSLQSELMRNRE